MSKSFTIKGKPEFSDDEKALLELCSEPDKAYIYLVEIKRQQFESVKKAVLSCFEKNDNKDAYYQCYNGEWYAPISGCDTLQDIIDSIGIAFIDNKSDDKD
jgi:hypothetical protein